MKPVSFALDAQQLAWIDARAKAAQCSRSRVVAGLIACAMERDGLDWRRALEARVAMLEKRLNAIAGGVSEGV